MSNSESASTRISQRPFGLLASIGCLYISFGITFGMMQSGLSPILRSQGMDIGSLGWLTAILLPFGLTFLWASWLDRIQFHLKAPRIVWIVAMQALTTVLLVGLGYAGTRSMPVLFGFALAIAFAAATMDIALDALTSRTVSLAHRPTAAGIKVGSLALGSMLGGGLFVVYFQQAGWMTIFLAMAMLTALATVPILGQIHRDIGVEPSQTQMSAPSLFRTVREAAHRRHLAVMALITIPVVLLFGLNRIMQIDIGLTLEQVGAIVGTVSPIASLLATGLAIVLLRRGGARITMAAFAGICLVAVGLLVSGDTGMRVAGAIGATAASSGIYVATSSLILCWANSNQPATDYAALYGLSRFLALIVLMLAAQAVPYVGWDAFFTFAGFALLVGVSIATRLIQPMLAEPIQSYTEMLS